MQNGIPDLILRKVFGISNGTFSQLSRNLLQSLHCFWVHFFRQLSVRSLNHLTVTCETPTTLADKWINRINLSQKKSFLGCFIYHSHFMQFHVKSRSKDSKGAVSYVSWCWDFSMTWEQRVLCIVTYRPVAVGRYSRRTVTAEASEPWVSRAALRSTEISTPSSHRRRATQNERRSPFAKNRNLQMMMNANQCFFGYSWKLIKIRK